MVVRLASTGGFLFTSQKWNDLWWWICEQAMVLWKNACETIKVMRKNENSKKKKNETKEINLRVDYHWIVDQWSMLCDWSIVVHRVR